MLFNSYEFIVVFLPVTMAVFFLLGKLSLSRYALFWLVFSSFFYYAWWDVNYISLILLSVSINFAAGTWILRFNDSRQHVKSRYVLKFGLMFNLLLLGYFKYSYFLSLTVKDLLGIEWNLYSVILPIGISFFTLQQIAYLIDTYKRKTIEHSFLQYSLFVVFFPQLIAGPIVHHKQMLPQFLKVKTFSPSFSNIAIGFSIFSIGLFKKVVLADNLALVVNPMFDMAASGQNITFLHAWAGTIAYSLQLYFDFSGYSDMAIGLGRMFGIILPLNFFSPYKASSIIEFWQRWHITLSTFLRDYIYIPLGGNREGRTRRKINIMLTMLIGGLWHGASWTFVAWGGLHGLYLFINYLWRERGIKKVEKEWATLLSRILTFLLISIAWVLFRASSFDASINIYKGMVDFSSIFISSSNINSNLSFYFGYYIDVVNLKSLLLFSFILVLLWFLPNTYTIFSNHHPSGNKMMVFDDNEKNNGVPKNLAWEPSILWSAFISLLFIISFINLTEVSEFIYFQF